MQLIHADTLIDIEQHFKIIAGPGAGKTRFLINHIKNVLHNSKRLGRNRKIACITYTNIGVETIVKRLGDETDHVEVSTIHSFLFAHIVKPFIFLIANKYNLDPLKIDGPYEHIPSEGFLQQTGLAYRRVTTKDMKRLFWLVDGRSHELALHIKGRKGDYNKSLFEYKKKFWEKGVIHYDDVLAFSWELLNAYPEILRIVRAKFPYLFIDEFQDTSPLQTEIIKLIAQKEVIIGVIGDKAQSIYEFNGADVKQFETFSLNNMSDYQINDNHRSTQEIIDILNLIRRDIVQRSPDCKRGKLPIIFVGKPLDALRYAKQIYGENEVVTLSFANTTANALRNNLEVDNQDSILIEEVFDEDSNSGRKKVLISIIKSIEYARVFNFKDAIRELSRHLKSKDNYNGQKASLEFIYELFNDYETFKNKSLWHLYEKVYDWNCNCFGLSKINSPKIEQFYRSLLYSEVAVMVRTSEDYTSHRTIHKAKGSEFENVFVIVKPKDRQKYKEDRDLAFLLNPDIENNEDHRVYYVACSRAMKNLFICVPQISEKAVEQLQSYINFQYCY
ncbi:UvrD-helicase domain-containing protein [Cohnella laeviribosi]|uniref:UvrD-helicase domain-containing protein n=1 Tax=Cohnella laeviribosi TaxID=380174 RepID=UPI0004769C7D|nr:ATP-dependent helicase [Cohnella laeviribosi]